MKKRFNIEEENFFEIAEENITTSSPVTAPHTLTPEEVIGSADSKKIIADSHSALDALKKRMSLSHQKLEKESNIQNSFSFDDNQQAEEKPSNEITAENKTDKDTQPKDNKSLLQEEIQKVKGNMLTYEEVGEEGPVHDTTFILKVSLNGEVIGEGKGKSKKEAEQNAAGSALEKIYNETR